MPNISEKGELWAARGAATVAVVIAGYFGIYPTWICCGSGCPGLWTGGSIILPGHCLRYFL